MLSNLTNAFNKQSYQAKFALISTYFELGRRKCDEGYYSYCAYGLILTA
jgi:hypothetical protein